MKTNLFYTIQERFGSFRSILAALFFLIGALRAEPSYQLSVCAIFKNEAPYLKEWIEYHQMVGVDHFYLYNNGSVDSFRKVLSPYIKKKIVTLINWPDQFGPRADSESIWPLSSQLSAYENALKWSALGKTKWLIFLDVDEFLVPSGQGKVTDLLNQYEDYPGITLASEFYDASHRSTIPQRKFVIESTEITAPPAPKLVRAVQKTILKPELCTSFVWPPYECRFMKGEKAVKINQSLLRINRYENRLRFQQIDFIRKKLPLDAKSLSEEEKNKYLKEGYEIEDQERAIYRYLPDLYKKLGYQ